MTGGSDVLTGCGGGVGAEDECVGGTDSFAEVSL